MAKREKVILVFMLLTVVVGGYLYFLSPPPEGTVANTEQELEELRQVVSQIALEISTENLNESENHRIAKAEAGWPGDRFYARRVPTAEEVAEASRPVFKYSGFLSVGATQMAIVNGMEYRPGEELELQGYLVKKIDPKQVVIASRETGEEIVVPYEELEP